MAYWDTDAGKAAHLAYCQAMGLGHDPSRWDGLSVEEQTAWCLAATAVLRLVKIPDDLAANLRHEIGLAKAKGPQAIFTEAVASGLIDWDGVVRQPDD